MRSATQIEHAHELLELMMQGRISVPCSTPQDSAAWSAAALALQWCCTSGEEGDDFSALLYLLERAAERAQVLV